MVTAIYTVYRKDGMSQEEFARYWTDVHAPIAREIPNIRSYDIYPVESATDAPDPQIDGFVVMTYDTADDLQAAVESPEMKAANEDSANFCRHFGLFTVSHTKIQ